MQLFGGYGYVWEYPITRAYADARVQRIYGGTNEIMKEVIARQMGIAGAVKPPRSSTPGCASALRSGLRTLRESPCARGIC